jgi:uncharacterized membrane protein YdjX (TVP38/TMEM64 family)
LTVETRRRLLGVIWMLGVGAALYIALFHRDLIESRLRSASDASWIAGGAVYLALGCLRGFTLIPMTSLLVMGILFFPPMPLFVLTMAGAMVSSVSIYYFSEALHLDDLFRRRYPDQIDRIRGLLSRYGFPTIVGWSFFPLTPTDLVCYVGGVLRINIWMMLAGIAIGKGAICALYIFAGQWVMGR